MTHIHHTCTSCSSNTLNQVVPLVRCFMIQTMQPLNDKSNIFIDLALVGFRGWYALQRTSILLCILFMLSTKTNLHFLIFFPPRPLKLVAFISLSWWWLDVYISNLYFMTVLIVSGEILPKLPLPETIINKLQVDLRMTVGPIYMLKLLFARCVYTCVCVA